MSHRIVESREAEWSGAEKLWAHVQQYNPRRGSWAGHIRIVMWCAIAALLAFGVFGL